MNKSVLAAFVLATVAPAFAQPAAVQQETATVPLDVFLEQRVVEELAADGTLLSRLGVALDVEEVGDKLIVSLVDLATRRAVASTKVDSIPADRDAAVAAITQVVANLAAQLSASTSPAAAAVKTVLTEERSDRAARELAEYKYRQAAISFGSELAVYSNGKTTTVGRTLVAYQGEERRRLVGREIYEALGREDLAQRYSNRTMAAWVGFLGGITAMSFGAWLYADNTWSSTGCYGHSTEPIAECEARWKDEHRGHARAGLVLFAGGAVGTVIGLYYGYNRHPLGESELYDLAAEHNARLRQQYGLPVSERRRARTSGPSLVVAPYALGDGGGLSVAGRF